MEYMDQKLAGGLEHDFFFPYIGNHDPNWLIFFQRVETTNQKNGLSVQLLEIVGRNIVGDWYSMNIFHSTYS